ncbi:hypothetical protein PR003_g14464 [Phytophthora rubi]|uniref:RxLR effector protein n=1 Tax=Phytophthora rubi TaxID=129364 RepID=A0A6A3LPJ3_9STRA|nr:hypothetical protein PR002_g13562 [Phytophthora rubi]KAE9020250.1 hypothetical protein PR001_g13653 [Phytophthora rubi]KAE9332534.1 hypothetical protein PR003_g14464 [Phytophthora rubi]
MALPRTRLKSTMSLLLSSDLSGSLAVAAPPCIPQTRDTNPPDQPVRTPYVDSLAPQIPGCTPR